MTCPRCGSDVPAAGPCPRCAAPVERTVVTGVLTPPPESIDAATALGLSGGFEDGATNVVGGALLDAADAATILPDVSAGSRVDRGPLVRGQAFGGRYHIIKELGVGGMGAVYQAFDTELGVAVAIKVIRPDVMADPSVAAEVERRFKRELLLAREVTHKNVVRIHDLGEIGGIKYITMAYVDGADLASLLKREGTLLVPSVLRIARAVVAGLVAAHKAGVVHRDLKPANIMIDGRGEPRITDFGLALLSSASVDSQVVA